LLDFAAVKLLIDTSLQGTMNLCLENQKNSEVGDRKDFGRIEASLYLKIKACLLACLLALTSFAQDSFSVFKKTEGNTMEEHSSILNAAVFSVSIFSSPYVFIFL